MGKTKITHNWKIENLIQINDGSGTISEVFYTVTSTDGDLVVKDIGMIKLETQNIENFIDYSNLTEEIVIQWIKEKLPSLNRDPENRNINVINEIRNPPKPKNISQPLPWIQSQPAVE